MSKNKYHFPIVDGHTHVYKDHVANKIIGPFSDFYQLEPVAIGKGIVSDVLQNMKKYQIRYTVLANFASLKSILDVNEWTLSVADNNPQLLPLVSVHPEMTHDMTGILEYYIQKGAKGIKMHTGIQLFEPNDHRLKPVYRFCGKHHNHVTFHCGETSNVHVNDFANMSHIYPVLEAYQDVPVILAHMAAGKPDEVYQIAEQYKNVYFDTSITITGQHCIKRIHDNFWENDKNVETAFHEIGCNRIIFGSDYPFGNPGSDIRRFMNMDLTDDDKSKILGGNVLTLYGIES
ncbi:MAG: amidohydrolase family protein [Tannerella sp.]|jgi:predicted TIM-barrel fold metal-dependent hydrolase|nr:amidohydrolase family protein [Tannerella sp.]